MLTVPGKPRRPRLVGAFVVLCFVFFGFVGPGEPLLADQEPTAVGIWVGTLQVPTGPLVLVIEIEAAVDGRLGGTLSIPSKRLEDLAIENVELIDGEFRFDFTLDQARFEGEMAEDDQSIEGTFFQRGFELPLRWVRTETAPEIAPRQQTPRAPFPYETQDVSIELDDDGVRLAGTLTLPTGPGPHPAAILLSVAGANDRDQSYAGHRPFLVLADALTRRGFAVLRTDDRGVGDSTGNLLAASYDRLAADALALFDWLTARADIDNDRVGFIGHSEGGAIGPLATSKDSRVAFVVVLGGPGLPGTEAILTQIRTLAEKRGLPSEEIERGLGFASELFEVLSDETDPAVREAKTREILERPRPKLPVAARLVAPGDIDAEVALYTSAWYRSQLRYRPETTFSGVACPILAVAGSKDLVLTPERHLAGLQKSFFASQSRDWSIVLLDGLNHLFQTAVTGSPEEYGTLEETFAPSALRAVGDWLAARFLDPRPTGALR